MNENEKYVAGSIKNWILSGFYTNEEIQSMFQDILEEDCNEEMLLNYANEEFKKKEIEEKSWPKITSFDYLNKAFYELHEVGICALHNAGYTMSDGHADVKEVVAAAPKNHYRGYCFYHGQDVERAISGGGLTIAFGSLNNFETETIEVGETVKNKLISHGFKIEWDSSAKTRINIPTIIWQKRIEPNISFKQPPTGAGDFLRRSFMVLLRKIFP